jgi:hypothetical protein
MCVRLTVHPSQATPNEYEYSSLKNRCHSQAPLPKYKFTVLYKTAPIILITFLLLMENIYVNTTA